MLLLITCWLLMLPAHLQPTFRVDADYVKVPVTVLDEKGRTLSDLTIDDLELRDEGELRPIQNFILDRSPISLIFLLDVSGSVKEELQEIRWATLRFAQTFGPDSRIAIYSFSDEYRQIQGWTNRLKDLRKSLKKLKPGYRTALYDAILTTNREKLRNIQGKKVIILLTDGLDNESEAGYEEVMNDLIAANTVLYIVSRSRLARERVAASRRVEFLDQVMKDVLDDEKSFVDTYFRAKEVAMNQLAEVTGGRALFPSELKALGESYLTIAQELTSQYVLTFAPPPGQNGRFRKIEVTCTRLQGVGRVYHREIYRAP